MEAGVLVVCEGRPAVVVSVAGVAAGEVGVRFTDVPEWERDPFFPLYERRPRGSLRVVPVASLVRR